MSSYCKISVLVSLSKLEIHNIYKVPFKEISDFEKQKFRLVQLYYFNLNKD